MNIFNQTDMKNVSILLAGLLLLSAGCRQKSGGNSATNEATTAAAGDSLTGSISFSGAFALYPMVVKWSEEFRKLHPQVRIDISGGGAGKGMTDALAKVVDLGMVSREIYDVEKENGAFGFAVTKDAVVATINRENPLYDELCRQGLRRETASALWNNGYATYGDLLGTDSSIPIHVYTRSDACGAAETWAAWFGKRQEQLEGTAVYSDPGVAAAIQKDKVGIGYNNIAYIYDMRTRKPYEGMAVLPIDTDENGQIDADELFYDTTPDLIAAIGDGRYPSPPARNLYLVSNGMPQNEVVVEFIRFALTEGQKYAIETGYIPLPQSTIDSELAKLNP